MKFLHLFLIVACFSCQAQKTKSSTSQSTDHIHKMLDAWHNAAAEANYEAYFNRMTVDGVFIGTDATENWQNEAFRNFSKPYFDKGKAWTFNAIERNIYIDNDSEHLAWFDELLNTQMGICRGSGIVKKENNKWKVAHYVLSIAVPNENVSELTEMKREWDSIQMTKMRKLE